MGRALLSVWQHCHDPTSVVHGQIRMMLQSSVQMQSIVTEASDCNYVHPPAFVNLMAACDKLLVLYSTVHQDFASPGTLLFNLMPKLHLLWHACEMSQYLHPKLSWCYVGPTVIQKLSEWLPHLLVKVAESGGVVLIAANTWVKLPVNR